MTEKLKTWKDRIPKIPANKKTKRTLPLIGNNLRFFEQRAIEKKAAKRMIEQFEQVKFIERLVSIAPVQRAFIETILERHGIKLPENISEIIPESAQTNDIRRKILIRISQETHENLKEHLTEEERTKIARYFHESNVKALKRLFKKLKKHDKNRIRTRLK